MNGWEILGVYPSVHGQSKIIARKGTRVIHADRIMPDEVASFDPQAYWDRHYA